MYKIIEIDNKEYKLEYTVEASLYKDCTKIATELMTNVMETVNAKEIKTLFNNLADIPSMVLPLFYAGLLEYHGECGDGTVKNINDAKKLIKSYFNEHKEDGKGNFYELMNICVEQMASDNFFDQSGIAQLMGEVAETAMPAENKPKVAKTTKTKK